MFVVLQEKRSRSSRERSYDQLDQKSNKRVFNKMMKQLKLKFEIAFLFPS